MMNEEYLDIREFVKHREEALMTVLQQVGSADNHRLAPYFIQRRTSSPFHFSKATVRRRGHRTKEEDKLHCFFAKRFIMKSVHSIFAGVREKLPLKHAMRKMRCIGRSLHQGGAIFYDVTPFLQVSKGYCRLRWLWQLSDYTKSLSSDVVQSCVRFIEILSRRPSVIDSIRKRMNVELSSSSFCTASGVFRTFLVIETKNISGLLSKADNSGFGVPSVLVGFEERRWVSLQINEPFDPRDMYSEYLCISISKGVPIEGQPFFTEDSPLSSEANVESMSSRNKITKRGIVTYGSFHEIYRRGAGFLHVKAKQPGLISNVRIGNNSFRCCSLT